MDENTTTTGGGANVGKNVETTGGHFTGRDMRSGESSVNNYINFDDQPRTSTQPPTLWQTVNTLVEKVDQILDLIQGDADQDIKGIRPRIREIEYRLNVLIFAVVMLAAAVVAVGLGWHW